MSIIYEEIRECQHVPQGEERISRKLISSDELGPCVFFLVDLIFQGKPVCYLKHYDFKEVNDSNMSSGRARAPRLGRCKGGVYEFFREIG